MKKHPKLRFPSYKDDYSPKKLSCFINALESGVSVNSTNELVTENRPGILKTSCVSNGKFYPEESKAIVSQEIDRAKLNPKKGAILISRMNTPQLVGEIGYVEEDFSHLFVPDRLWQAKLKDNVDSKWLTYQLISPRLRYSISSIGTGTSGSMKNISKSNFMDLDINNPSINEQKKIASFLNSVDRRIALLERKKAKLEEYKKGVMQKLFSQEIRFKGENEQDFPDWEEKRLGEVGRFYGGGTPDSSNKSFWKGSIPWISSSDLSENSILEISKTRFISEEAVLKSATKLIPPKSVLVVTRVGVGKIGYCHEAVCTSQDFTSISPKKDFNPLFLGFLLMTNSLKLQRFCQGTSIKGMTSEDLKNLRVLLPSLNEQRKIVDFLKSLERLIKNQSAMMEKMKSWKKGLLQKMFV